jgi:hypothetical protein
MLYCDNIFKSYGHYNNVVHTCRVLPKINTLGVFSLNKSNFLSYLFYVYLIGDVTLDGISKCNSDNDTQVHSVTSDKKLWSQSISVNRNKT